MMPAGFSGGGSPERRQSRLDGVLPDGHSCRLQGWQELLLSWIAGAIVAFLCAEGLVRQSLPKDVPEVPEVLWNTSYFPDWPKPAECNIAYLPRGIGLNPTILQREAKNKSAVPDRLLVVARHREDVSWLDVYLPEVPHIIYQVDEPELTVGLKYKTLVNKGNEAMAYLQFILDFYDRLPEHIVFIHGHRGAWHLMDKVGVLRRLRWGSFPFANLRYSPGDRLPWVCGNRTSDPTWKQFSCSWIGLMLRPQGMGPRKRSAIRVTNHDEWIDSLELQSNWKLLFERELGKAPSLLGGPCCAEFMVSRERILKHPLSFYKLLRNWIVEVELDRYRTGRVMEYMWHYIFGEPAVAQPKFECDLLHCNDAQLREAMYWRDAANTSYSLR